MHVQERWQALRLSRRQKAAALAAASLCIWMSAGWTTRLQVLLLGALTVRCNLKPAEVRARARVVDCFSLHQLLRRNVRLHVDILFAKYSSQGDLQCCLWHMKRADIAALA